jgi:DNA polymerase-3 subunit delta'
LHPDVQIFEPEGFTFPVESIRQIVNAAAGTPMESTVRVFLLEEAHRITERSQNALLKGLEEPGQSVTWILTTDTLEPLLPTVLSRCQIIEFPPMGDEAIAGLVESRFGLDGRQAAGIARAAAGSVDMAVKLASDDLAGKVRALALESATQPHASPHRALAAGEAVGRIALESRAILERRQKAELADFDETIGKGKSAAGARKKLLDRHKRALRRAETEIYLDFLFWLGSAYRDMAALSSGAPSGALVFAEIENAEPGVPSARRLAFYLDSAQACGEAQLAIRENANASLIVESTLLRSAVFPGAGSG